MVMVVSLVLCSCCGDNGESAALAFHSALLRRGLAAIAFSDRRRWRGRRVGAASQDMKMASAEQLVLDLCDPELRENALLELSKVQRAFF